MKTYDTLIEPNELQATLAAAVLAAGSTHTSTAALAIVDCRFDLARPAAGREAYAKGHIPGAVYAHLDEDLSGPLTPVNGRHPLPDVHRFAARLAQWGIGPATQVIAYDETHGAFAVRLWWLLRWLGHRKVAVLNGGFKAWEAAGYPVDTAIPAAVRAAAPFPVATLEKAAWLTTEQIQQGLADGSLALIDARAADRFAGRNEIIDPVAGHIPGARNHPFATNVDANQRFLPAEQLRERWLNTLAGTPASQAVCMCGSGVTAAHNLLALEIAGLRGARLYAGSWSEWIKDPRRPVASGA